MTYEEAKQKIAALISGADRYGFTLQSHIDYSTEEVVKILEDHAKSKWDEALELAARRAKVTRSIQTGEKIVDTDSILSLKDKFKP